MSATIVKTAEADIQLDRELVYKVLTRVGMCLNIAVGRTELELGSPDTGDQDELDPLIFSARRCGILLKEAELEHVQELVSCLHEGYAVILAKADGSLIVCEQTVGNRVECTEISEQSTTHLLRPSQIQRVLEHEPGLRVLVAKQELELESLSNAPASHEAQHHEHPTPLRRFLGFLRLEARDIGTVAIFALVSGLLALATPLAIEALVNVVSWGTYLQPLVVLAVILLVCLGLAGILKILQTIVVEIIQRRQLVRIVGDLAHRFPRANQKAMEGHYPRELANRLFDIMTIQKATAVLLLDGVSIVLTTVLGLLLLAFYHPFLLGFDIALVISMVSITWLLGRGGIRTAVEESIAKYKIAHWLQDVLATPTAFKINGGETLAVERANRLATEYLAARQRQFRVVIRQVAFAVGLQVIASTALLGLGGWLVMKGQLTLGQLVASELVVTVVIGAFAKAGKSLEKYYDLMAGIDKVGHLLDIPADPRYETVKLPNGPASVSWNNLKVDAKDIPAFEVEPGSCVAIVGDDASRKSQLAKSVAGIVTPTSGAIEVGGLDARHAALGGAGNLVSYAGQPDIFHGSLRENVDLGRSGIGQTRVREALQHVGLWDSVLRLKDGVKTSLQSDGYPLSREQSIKLMIARAIVARPHVLVIDGVLDELHANVRNAIWNAVASPNSPWTLVVATNSEDLPKHFQTIDISASH